MLCHFYRVFPKYLQCVFKFSQDTCRGEEYFSGGCYRHVYEDESKGSVSGMFDVNDSRNPISNYVLEISYNVRHFEKHGRELQDPWSSRQCSVYQSYSHRNNASTWILIQIPSRTRCHLERLNSEGEGSSPDNHPMDMHLHLLVSCEKNWGPYIGYLGNEVSLIVSPSTMFPNVPGQYYVVLAARINSTSDRSKPYVFERNSLSMCPKART